MDSETDSNQTINEETKKLNKTKQKDDKADAEIKAEKNLINKCKPILEWLIKYLISLVLGFLFGYAMEKAKVYEPKAIRQQMIFSRFIMLKMFLSAFATSTLSIFLAALIFKKRYEFVFQSAKKALETKSLGILIIGGVLIGVGMQISGSCPGMVLVQLGAGVSWSYLTFIGALCGALCHGFLEQRINSSGKVEKSIGSKALFELVCIPPVVIRIMFIVLLGIIVFLMEFFIPWTNEYADAIPQAAANIFIYKAWPPYVCGIVLGSLQFVTLIVLQKSLGASSFYSSCVAILFCTANLKTRFTYMAKMRDGLQNWLALAFTIGSILGAFASAYSSDVWGKSQGVHPYNAFLGGFVMVFGARIAGGCTSGHGISGSSHQLIGSLVTTMAMFGGAIILAFYALTNDFFS